MQQSLVISGEVITTKPIFIIIIYNLFSNYIFQTQHPLFLCFSQQEAILPLLNTQFIFPTQMPVAFHMTRTRSQGYSLEIYIYET